MTRFPSAHSSPWLFCCAALVFATVFAGCAAPLPTQRKWIEVESENFTITSSMDEAETVELAQRLELFRASVLALTTVDTVESSVPTYLYAFDSLGSFRSFQPKNAVVGYIISAIRGNYVALVDAYRMEVDEILRHEYIHYIVRNRTSLVYPKWYDEGFAEFMSTVDVRGENVVVGLIPKERVKQFSYTRWISMSRILAYDGTQNWPPEDVGMFYAQSWGLLHYLLQDVEHRERFSSAIGTYLKEIEAGASIEAASVAAFEMTPPQLDRELKRYLQRGSFQPFGVKESSFDWSRETTSRPLREAVVAARLGVLALHRRDAETAGRLFAKVLELEPDLARAHAGMGDVLKLQEQWDEAKVHFERAVELDSDDPLNQLDIGEYWQLRAQKTEDFDTRHAMLRTARRHFVKAYKLDGTRPEPYAVYGQSFLFDGEDPAKGIETLEHAESLLPSNLTIRLWLAEAYVKVDRDDEARRRLATIIAWGHGGSMTEEARALLGELDGGDADSEVVGAN